jgi:hypothetical protein
MFVSGHVIAYGIWRSGQPTAMLGKAPLDVGSKSYNGTMKRTIVACLFASCAFAGDQGVIARACGPEAVTFDVKTGQPLAALPKPDAGKALVFVIQDRRLVSECIKCTPTVRIGVDGNWMGAQHHDSWLSFSVQPGSHHLCADLQGERGRSAEPKRISLASFTAEAGAVYYFRVRTTNDRLGWTTVDVGAVNSDEAELLVTSYPPSSSQPQK